MLDVFVKYPKIPQLDKSLMTITQWDKSLMTITQKIHGTNAQVVVVDDIEETSVYACSRNRQLSVENDNFGFAQWVAENKVDLFLALGPGRHYGEWAGPGINNGEGLKERTFVLFDTHRYDPVKLPANVCVVPVLYEGAVDRNKIDEVMAKLKEQGSKLVHGFMNVEGVVIDINGNKFKQVFEPEETVWKKDTTAKVREDKTERADYSNLLHPIRMEKIMSREESFITNFPASVPMIIAAYITDLTEEGWISNENIVDVRRQLSKFIFKMAESIIASKQFYSKLIG